MTSPPTPTPLRFLEFELDLSAFQLRRDGRVVRLERQPMDLLILLVERRGTLVTREEIVDRLWGKDVFVDVETGVHTAIRKIRQALRDDPDAPRCVETVTGRGYRFVAPVEVGAPPAAVPPGAAAVPERRRVRPILLVAAVAVAAALAAFASRSRQAVADRVTIAVLPFENLTGDADREYLADGLAEEMIVAFGHIDPRRLGVIGRRSTLAYKGARKSLGEIGRELGADFLVEGSVRDAGGRLRITSRLVRVPEQTQVWSASFDREPTSVVALQQELSTAIAKQIHLRLAPEQLTSLARRHTANAEAYDLYMRGRFTAYQRTPEANRRALELFERAIAIDDGYALAWAGIANVLAASPINSDVAPAAVHARMHDAAARAVAAGPDVAEAHVVRGQAAFMFEWDWAAAERALRRAIALDPGSGEAHRLLGHVLSQAGRQREAVASMTRARELEPLHALNHAVSSQVAFQGRDYASAVELARRAVAIEPEFWIGHVMLAQAAEQLGQHDLALEAIGRAARYSDNNTKTMSFRGHLLAKLGRTDEAREVRRALDAVARERYVPPYAIALVHAGLGECDAAFGRLEEALAARDVHLIFLHVDPRWDGCRRDARFAGLVDRAGLRVRR